MGAGVHTFSSTVDVGPKSMFVILTSQRTGSTLLARSLDSSRRILCAGEIFHSGRGIHRPEFQYPCKSLGSYGLGRLRDAIVGRRRIHRHLKNFYLVDDARLEAVGFKLMLSQTRQYPSIIETLVVLGARFLFLYREDPVATALSHCRARATGVFHSDRLGRSRGSSDIVVSESEFSRILSVCRSDRDELIRLHGILNGSLMRYEDMIADWPEFVGRVGIDIGVHGLQVPMALEKLSRPAGVARIANENALIAKFGDGSSGSASARMR